MTRNRIIRLLRLRPQPPPLVIRVRARVGCTQSGWHGFPKSSLIQPISHLVLFQRQRVVFLIYRMCSHFVSIYSMCSVYTCDKTAVVSASARWDRKEPYTHESTESLRLINLFWTYILSFSNALSRARSLSRSPSRALSRSLSRSFSRSLSRSENR